jgi:hypothetical protein
MNTPEPNPPAPVWPALDSLWELDAILCIAQRDDWGSLLRLRVAGDYILLTVGGVRSLIDALWAWVAAQDAP